VAPDRVVHTAYRQHPRDINIEGSANVARAAARRHARLVHLSTDVVFGGRLGRPYRETDRPDPVNDYGRAKADAERIVADLAPGAAIVRTSLMLAGDEPSQHERIALEAAEGRAPYAFYTDEMRCPLAVADAAAAVIELAHLAVSGILHVVGPEAVSRYELACLVARAYGRSTDAIPSTSGAAADGRASDCRLDGSWARTLLATKVRGVRAVMDEVAQRRS
jgi:dTDP-4-dehydrorhamnose reductase